MEEVEKKRILVIEDEVHIADGILLNLSIHGFEAMVAEDGIKGLELWRSWQPDLIVLDIMLPMIDGFSILKIIRKEDEKIPVLILSARGDTKDKVKGLKYGVDDYLSKPFDLEEFLLRVERLLKKKAWYKNEKNEKRDKRDKRDNNAEYQIFDGDEYEFGKNQIDFITSKANCAAGEIILTEQELVLLKLFIGNKGKPLSREILLTAGWGYSKDTTTRTVDNFIVRFRKYFETIPKNPKYFISRRSVGYVFDHE